MGGIGGGRTRNDADPYDDGTEAPLRLHTQSCATRSGCCWGSMMFDAVVLNADDTVWFGSSKRRRTAGLAELLDTSGATRLKGPAHNGRELRLWGLTFGMTLDLVRHHLGVS